MRVSSQAITLLSLLASSNGFLPSVSFVKKTSLLANLHEFDYLLGENSGNLNQQKPLSRRALLPFDAKVKQTSLVAEEVAQQSAVDDGYTDEDFLAESETAEVNEYGQEVGKLNTFQEKQASNGAVDWIKQADLQEILWTLAVPAVVGTIGFRYVSEKVSTKLEGNAGDLLDSFATEMLYHDGDFEEMKMCQKDYGKRLLWLGLKRNDAMLKKYLELYAKKKTVTPKAIR